MIHYYFLITSSQTQELLFLTCILLRRSQLSDPHLQELFAEASRLDPTEWAYIFLSPLLHMVPQYELSPLLHMVPQLS